MLNVSKFEKANPSERPYLMDLKEYADMTYNPTKGIKTFISDNYDLKYLAEESELGFYKSLNKNMIMAYICFLYDPGSPLKLIKNYEERKMLAYKMSGLNLPLQKGKSKNVSITAEDIIYNKSPIIRKLIAEYLNYNSNVNYTMICLYNESILELMITAMTPVTDITDISKLEGITKSKKEAMKTIIHYREEITKHAKSLFGSDDYRKFIGHYIAVDTEEMAEKEKKRKLDEKMRKEAKAGSEKPFPEAFAKKRAGGDK